MTNDEKPDKKDLCDRTFAFSLRIMKLCEELHHKPGIALTLSNQLLRSGTSIGANIEEAQAAQSRPDFVSKYSIARKEARETRYWLRLIGGGELIPLARLVPLQKECDELIAILTTIIKKTSSK